MAGVLRQISEGNYDRQYAADELFDLIEAYEERVAGDQIPGGGGCLRRRAAAVTLRPAPLRGSA